MSNDDFEEEDDITFTGNGEDMMNALTRQIAQQSAGALPARGPGDDDDGDDDQQEAAVAPPPRRGPGRPRKNQIPIPETAVHQTQPPETDMSQRRRSQNAMNQPQPNKQPRSNVPILREVPTDRISQLMADGIHNNVFVKFHNRNQRGNIAYSGHENLTLDQVANIEDWLVTNKGGGRWMISVHDETDNITLVLPKFEVEIDAPIMTSPQKASNYGNAPGVLGMPPPMGGMPFGAMPAVDPRTMTPWMRAAPHDQQMAWAQQMSQPQGGVHSQPVMTFTPDQIATAELDKAQKALQDSNRARELERREREKAAKEMEAKFEALQKSINDEKMRMAERERVSEMAALRDEMRRREESFKAMLDGARNQKPVFDWQGFAAIAAAAAPVVTAMISSSKEQATKTIELQTQSANRLLEATMKQADSKPLMENILKMAPLVIPLMKDYFANKSPKAHADLVATMAENNLSTIGMVAKLMSEMTSDSAPDSPWMPLIQETLRSVVAAAEGMARSSKQQAGMPVGPSPYAQQQAPQLQQPQLTPAQQANGEGQVQPPQMEQQYPPSPVTLPYTGEQVADFLSRSADVPNDIKTPPWFNIISKLHDRHDPAEVAQLFAKHMRDLDKQGLPVPEPLAGFWEGGETAMHRAFSMMPIGQHDPRYVAAFIEEAMEILAYEEAPLPPVTQMFNSAPVPQKAS